VHQREGETLKDYLNRFCTLTVKLQTHDENVTVSAFEQGVPPKRFCDSLIRRPPENFSKIRRRAVAHINAEEAITARNNGSHSRLAKPKEVSKTFRPVRVTETSVGKKAEARHHPYKKEEFKERGKRKKFVPSAAYRTRN